MASGISVIICCYNSASRIAPTLQHLYKQNGISLSSWEIIIINNCSTDNTAEKAIEIWDSFTLAKPNFKVINELNPGLSAARLKGISESFYDYILFCDDDNWLDENYLNTALNIISSNPAIGALGGTGNPIFEYKEPPYFWVNQFHVLAVGSQLEIEGDITDQRGVLYGAGMVLNKNAFNILQNTFQFHFQLTDRLGNKLLSSGDHELCLALKQIGYRIYYSKNLKFKHYIPSNRTTIPYYKKLFLGFGMSNALLHVYQLNKNNYKNIKNDYRYIILRCLKNIVLINIKMFFNGYFISNNKYKYLEQVQSLYNNVGQLKTFLKTKNSHIIKFSMLPLFNINSKFLS
jgi:glycosyltransferase involved in cell wall biosynthesis